VEKLNYAIAVKALAQLWNKEGLLECSQQRLGSGLCILELADLRSRLEGGSHLEVK
jgi:hypothetical protein